jgi:hypothetical protein
VELAAGLESCANFCPVSLDKCSQRRMEGFGRREFAEDLDPPFRASCDIFRSTPHKVRNIDAVNECTIGEDVIR